MEAPSLCELTPMIFDMWLTHLGSKASILVISDAGLESSRMVFFGVSRSNLMKRSFICTMGCHDLDQSTKKWTRISLWP